MGLSRRAPPGERRPLERSFEDGTGFRFVRPGAWLAEGGRVAADARVRLPLERPVAGRRAYRPETEPAPVETKKKTFLGRLAAAPEHIPSIEVNGRVLDGGGRLRLVRWVDREANMAVAGSLCAELQGHPRSEAEPFFGDRRRRGYPRV